jgi:CBS domain-containing membrane protein
MDADGPRDAPGMKVSAILSSALLHCGPAMGRTAPRELARATLGTVLAIVLCDLILWTVRHSSAALPGGTGEPLREVIILAPLAATAFLIMTVPNSPLAQPWSVIVGNSLGAVAALITAVVVPFPVLAVALSVGLAVLAMESARALHPPSAAVALNVGILSYSGTEVGPLFIFSTVTAGSVILVIFGILFNRATGRSYPFRQPPETLPSETAYLADLLQRLRLSANIGVADLLRVTAAAEAEATARHLGTKAAEGMMTHNPHTLGPDADITTMRAAFARHTFLAIPVAQDRVYLGLLSQMALIGASDAASAGDLMENVPVLGPQSDLPEILSRLTDGGQRVLPVVEAGKLVGIITRSDLIGVLARAVRHAGEQDTEDGPVTL